MFVVSYRPQKREVTGRVVDVHGCVHRRRPRASYASYRNIYTACFAMSFPQDAFTAQKFVTCFACLCADEYDFAIVTEEGAT